MAKRLSDKQKEEIVRKFRDGNSIDHIAKEFNCTKLTISRNLSKYIGENEYKSLNSKKFSLDNKSSSSAEINEDFKMRNKEFKENVEGLKDSEFTPFIEITPLSEDIDNAPQKDLSSVPITQISLPKVVYMVVDKKIELEIKLLKDFPEWEFLPYEDLNRKTIEIFFDLNLAKRSCNKEQKVLKVPNTDVFRIAAPILLDKGISRIVCAENLIAL